MWKSNILIDLKHMYLNDLIPIYGKDESLQMLNILIGHYFGLSRVEQTLKSAYKLSESEMLKLHMAVKQLKKNKPLQYIIGETTFIDYKIKVNEWVLIPRPETEELVKLILDNENLSDLNILDIGTGSGCIAIALAANITNSHVYAMDISKKAIETAKQNANINNVNIQFIEDDINKPSSKISHNFDVIVSNPPYVRYLEKSQMKPNVLDYEPEIALFVDDNKPLKFYTAIMNFAKLFLNDGGRLYFEINEALADELRQSLLEYNYDKISIFKDINGKNRFVSAVKVE